MVAGSMNPWRAFIWNSENIPRSPLLPWDSQDGTPMQGQVIKVMKSDARTQRLVRALLACGAVAGPFFIAVVLIQDYTRVGYDPRVQGLSQLTLGDLGIIQRANFILAGLLNLCYAFGLWKTLHPGRGGTWGPLLIGAYGLGLVTVGIFTPDPANGFPPGASTPAQPSPHAMVHALGGLFVFLTLAAALFVLARLFRERHQRWWAVYCLVSGILLLVLFFVAQGIPELFARFLRLGVFFGWGAASLIAVHLIRASDTTFASSELEAPWQTATSDAAGQDPGRSPVAR
jgi:hypothetical protein